MTLTVSQTEHGLLRVFRLSDSLSAALKNTTDLSPLEKALGVIIANPADVQIIAADALDDMSPAQFLTMAYDVDSAALADSTALQAGTSDSFAIIRTGAFGGAAVTISESADANLVATLPEGGPSAPSMTPLQSQSAKGAVPPQPTKPPKSDARVGGMIAVYVLLFLFALVGLMIWIGG